MSVFVEASGCAVEDVVGRPALVDAAGGVTVVTAVRGSEVFTAAEPGRARVGADVVVLPVIGELVAVRDGGGDVEGVWLGLVQDAAGVGGGVVEAFVLCGSGVRVVRAAAVEVEARRVVSGRAVEGARPALVALLAEARAGRGARRAHAERLERLVEDAHEWADDNSLCSRFDDFMEAHGFPRRRVSYDLRVVVRATVRVCGLGSSVEDAIASLTSEEVLDALTAGAISWNAEEDD